MKTKPLFASVIATLLLLLHPSLSESIGPPPDEKCGGATFMVEDQPDAPVLLTVMEASCEEEHHWKAKLTLENISSNVIHGYEVAWVEAYEHKKDVRSGLEERGSELKSGESRELFPNGGFLDGRSYGKPTGALQRVVFRIAQIEFSDGTEWRPNSSKQ
jgi:hypothetical protein